MDYTDWLKLFGHDSDDEALKALLAKRGVKAVPPIKKGELDARVQLDDSMLIFATAELFPGRSSGGDGSSVLQGLVLPLKGYKWGQYEGELPFKLQRSDGQADLRRRFGDPKESNTAFNWDEWNMDGLLVRVTYDKDYKSLKGITLKLPYKG
jgi:hypothetical protein